MPVQKSSLFTALQETFLSDEAGAISSEHMVLAVVLSFALGGIIWVVYAHSYVKSRRSVLYSSTFGLSLLAMTMITTAMLLAIGSRVGLSLGMVGALSIVRFRAAIKEPLEIVFLFWAIETGALLAAGLFPLALMVNLLIAIVLICFIADPLHPESYLLILKGTVDSAKQKAFRREVSATLMGDEARKQCGIDRVSLITEKYTDSAKQDGDSEAKQGGETGEKDKSAARKRGKASKSVKEDTAKPGTPVDFELNYEIRMRRKFRKPQESRKSVCGVVADKHDEVSSAALIRYNGDYV